MSDCTLSVLIENRTGALSRLVGLFSQRGYNIETLSVAPTSIPGVSRLTLSTAGDEKVLEQIKKHLNKLIDVIKLKDITESEHLERELMLIKLRPSPRRRDEVMHLCDSFQGRVVDTFAGGYTIQLTGTEAKLSAFAELLREDEIMEMVRTGICAMARGSRALEI